MSSSAFTLVALLAKCCCYKYFKIQDNDYVGLEEKAEHPVDVHEWDLKQKVFQSGVVHKSFTKVKMP